MFSDNPAFNHLENQSHCSIWLLSIVSVLVVSLTEIHFTLNKDDLSLVYISLGWDEME